MAPIQGATFICANCTTSAEDLDIWYFTDVAMTLIGGTSTGPSGGVLFRGDALTDGCTASATDYTATTPVACGVFQGRASLGIIGMLAD